MLADERNGNTEPRRAIDYMPNISRYTDRIENADDADEGTSSGRAIEEGNRKLNNALPGYIPPEEQPVVNNEWTTN
jgi:hypothetical protein